MGHVIYEEGITIDLDKVETIMEWPTIGNVRNVISLKGLECYYKRFIKGFSRVAHPITSLERKHVNFAWFAKCEDNFLQLEELLTSALVLKNANLRKDFVVCTEACIEGLGGVLIQEGYVVCYESIKLKENEKNSMTHDLELAIIVHAFKMQRHYLPGRKFERKTYHMSLKYLLDKPNLNARQNGWNSCLILILKSNM